MLFSLTLPSPQKRTGERGNLYLNLTCAKIREDSLRVDYGKSRATLHFLFHFYLCNNAFAKGVNMQQIFRRCIYASPLQKGAFP